MLVKTGFIKLIQIILFSFLDLIGCFLEGVYLIWSKLFNVFKVSTTSGVCLIFFANSLQGAVKFSGMEMAFWMAPMIDFIVFGFIFFALLVAVLSVIRLIILCDD